MANEEIIHNISLNYAVQILKAFNNEESSITALDLIGKKLKELYRFFEPCFFNGEFYVCKNFNDKPCFSEDKGISLYDKSILVNRTSGLMIIQVFSDGKLLMWENEDPNVLIKQEATLIYLYHKNKEFFFADGNQIEITIMPQGSRFSTQYIDLVDALQIYATKKIYQSSCTHFAESWKDFNMLFFKGGGSGSNIPEKYMQMSLDEFLGTYFIRGIDMETSREFNLIGDSSKPKPVDIRLHWREANRIALLEIKFMGTIKKEDDEIYSYNNSRANAGILQLKGYHDKALKDSPTTILKSYLVVIDGRRNNLTKDTATINDIDGMYYKDVEIVIDPDKMFHETVQGFEKPIRMFAKPVIS